MFKNMGGNIPGGNFLGGNFPGGSLMGGNFPDTEITKLIIISVIYNGNKRLTFHERGSHGI